MDKVFLPPQRPPGPWIPCPSPSYRFHSHNYSHYFLHHWFISSTELLPLAFKCSLSFIDFWRKFLDTIVPGSCSISLLFLSIYTSLRSCYPISSNIRSGFPFYHLIFLSRSQWPLGFQIQVNISVPLYISLYTIWHIFSLPFGISHSSIFPPSLALPDPLLSLALKFFVDLQVLYSPGLIPGSLHLQL